MSCITQLLELKGNAEYLRGGECYVIEGGGVHKDYEYLITFTDLGSRCGYVAIRERDNDIADGVNCHGGVTFNSDSHHAKTLLPIACKDTWIGFDCGHYGDMRCYKTANKYFGHTEGSRYKLDLMEDLHKEVHEMEERDPNCSHKSYEYVERECKYIIEQLVARHG